MEIAAGGVKPSGAVTFLFTDVEGATQQVEADPDGMRTQLAAIDGVLRHAVESRGGWLFQTTGDGVCAAFRSARAAVGAAIDAQRSAQLPLRMGIATGEVEQRGSDDVGTAVHRAAHVMRAGHGGQILVSGSTAALLTGIDLRDLGEHRLGDLSVGNRLYQVRADGLVDEFPRVRVVAPVGTGALGHVELLGREREVSDVEERLATRRLVTVVGPGGMGKTALARWVLGAAGPGGTVDLTAVWTDDAVPGAVASQLGHPSFEALLASPAPAAPVIIDNCEHVLGGAASTIDRLLDAGTDWRLLATSRSPLNVAAESVVALGPLATSAARSLFLLRARDAGSDIDPANIETLETVDDLCGRLDGVPLAIEIAAARTRVLTPQMILEQVRSGVDVLQRPNFRGPDRHRSVRETIAWSSALLDDGERTALARLSVCAGPFDLDLAAAVIAPETSTAAGGDDASTVLGLLDALVDASLVAVDGLSPSRPYRLLETIRRFALAELEHADERAPTEDRFIAHVVDRVTTIMERGRAGWSADVLRDLLAEYDNIALGLSSSLQRDPDPTRSLLMCSVLWGVIHNGHVDDVAQLAGATLDRWPDPSHALWPDAMATLATATLMLGDIDDGVALAESALPHAATSFFAPVTLRRMLGLAAQASGDHERAAMLFAAASAAARQSGAMAMAMESDVLRAQSLSLAGRHDDALDEVRRVRNEAEAGSAQINSVFAAIVEGLVLATSDPIAAWSVLAGALETSRTSQYPYGVTASLLSLAYTYLCQGRDDAAASTIGELVDEMAASPSDWSRADPLGPVAAIMHRRGMSGWEDVATTARWRARTSPLRAAGLHLVGVPETDGRVLPARQATDIMFEVLTSVRNSPTPPPRDDSTRRSVVAQFTLDGEMWTLSWSGSTVYVKASKGMTDLAELLAHPGVEISCLDLAGAVVDDRNTGDVIDAAARRQYEDRLRELQSDIDDAQASSDHARAERAQAEFDAIVDHLTAALGLGGRFRRHGDTAERARSAVTRRIRDAVKRIESVHPQLGAHLRRSVDTGLFCSYRPETPVQWLL